MTIEEWIVSAAIGLTRRVVQRSHVLMRERPDAVKKAYACNEVLHVTGHHNA